jgi:hypothetical protein
MRSLRLDDQLERRLQKAAAAEGTSVSEFIRRAADERAARTLADESADRLGDIIGAVRTTGGRASRSGKAFADLLADRRRLK